jgi:hydroxyacylglutathione hydrolase
MSIRSTVELLPIFKNNYVFLIQNLDTHEAIVIDPGESTAVKKALEQQKLKLKALLITHHHPDHTDGLADLVQTYKVPVYAPFKNQQQIQADHYLEDKAQFQIAGFNIKTMALPGHTLGILAYWFSDQHWLFSGDVLFGLGCGRLFEGSFEVAWNSLNKIKTLPDDSLVYCAHEYTEDNLRFFKTLPIELKALVQLDRIVNYENDLLQKRSQKLPSVPLLLSTEKSTNPFLMSDLADFTRLRKLRNEFA